ncbi:hypothetical protein D3C85_1737140 [compost metagenome]
MIAAVPKRTPEVTNGERESNGTIFLFVVIPAFPKTASASLPEISLLRRSTNIKWLSVPPEIIL